MSQVIVFPRGQLSPEDKASMREMGIAVVEADDPSKVVTVIPVAAFAPLIDPEDFTMSLLHTVASCSDGVSGRFTDELYRRALAREKAKAAPSMEVDCG